MSHLLVGGVNEIVGGVNEIVGGVNIIMGGANAQTWLTFIAAI